jgi:hypothetical protein
MAKKKQKPARQKLRGWIGRQVRVGLNLRGSTTTVGILQGSDRLGIYLRHSVLEGERPVFYPWEVVFWVYPTEEQGVEEARARPSGDPPVDPESIIG